MFVVLLGRVAYHPKHGGRRVRRSVLLDGLHVLVVDDTTIVREVLRAALDAEGARVTACSSGDRAIRLAGQLEFDAIVLDIRMPGLTGFDVYEQLSPSSQHRVVFVTGSLEDQDVQDFLDRTQRPALPKPVELARFVEAVREVSGD